MCRSDANQQLFSMKMLWPDKQTSMFYLRLLSVVALIGPSIFYLVVGLSFFCVSFLIGTDQSANRWPPTVAIPRQSDRPSSSLIRFHLQQQQQQQDPLSRHLLGSLASFLLPVSLNLSEYIFFFSRVSTWKKKKNFRLPGRRRIIFDGLTARLPLIYFLLKDATWLTDDTRSNLFGIFFFSHSWIISFHILKRKEKRWSKTSTCFEPINKLPTTGQMYANWQWNSNGRASFHKSLAADD